MAGRAGAALGIDPASQLGDGPCVLPVGGLTEVIGQRSVKAVELLLGVLLVTNEVRQRRAPGGGASGAGVEGALRRASAGDVSSGLGSFRSTGMGLKSNRPPPSPGLQSPL